MKEVEKKFLYFSRKQVKQLLDDKIDNIEKTICINDNEIVICIRLKDFHVLKMNKAKTVEEIKEALYGE